MPFAGLARLMMPLFTVWFCKKGCLLMRARCWRCASPFGCCCQNRKTDSKLHGEKSCCVGWEMRSTQKQYIHYIPEDEGGSHTQLRRWAVVVEMNGAGAVMGRGLGSPPTHPQPLAAVRFEVDPGQVTYHSHSGRNIMELLWPELSPRLQQRRQSTQHAVAKWSNHSPRRAP
jgi:hypothetical protein